MEGRQVDQGLLADLEEVQARVPEQGQAALGDAVEHGAAAVPVAGLTELPDEFRGVLLAAHGRAHGHPGSPHDAEHEEGLAALRDHEHLVAQQGQVRPGVRARGRDLADQGLLLGGDRGRAVGGRGHEAHDRQAQPGRPRADPGADHVGDGAVGGEVHPELAGLSGVPVGIEGQAGGGRQDQGHGRDPARREAVREQARGRENRLRLGSTRSRTQPRIRASS